MSTPLRAYLIPRDISDIALDDTGQPRIMSADWWLNHTTAAERALLCWRHGLYSLPTTELVDWLRETIAGRTAIEIGAGNGALAGALGIPATDNRQQETEYYRSIYARMGQPTVRYGDNVIRISARKAVRHYRPQVVVGCWITHRYRRDRDWAGGNQAGVDEHDVLANCDLYVHVGNSTIHDGKAINDLPHQRVHEPWLYSRKLNPSHNIIQIWGGTK